MTTNLKAAASAVGPFLESRNTKQLTRAGWLACLLACWLAGWLAGWRDSWLAAGRLAAGWLWQLRVRNLWRPVASESCPEERSYSSLRVCRRIGTRSS